MAEGDRGGVGEWDNGRKRLKQRETERKDVLDHVKVDLSPVQVGLDQT